MKTENPQLLMKCFFNEGLLLDKEMNFYLIKQKQPKVKTPKLKLQLVWDKI